ncbi:MAG: DNA-binding response regulator, partial [Elusimicrobia bacterium CG08_land_8_20_14_0_20_59_10]
AQTLAEACEKINSQERLDLLVTDLNLPDGQGLDVIRAARAKFPAAGVVVITALLSPETLRDEFQSLGVSEDDILSKPFAVSTFEAAVKAQLQL